MKNLFSLRNYRYALVLDFLLTSYFVFTPLSHKAAGIFSDKVYHFIAFSFLAWLLDGSYRPWLGRVEIKLMLLLCYAFIIEMVQYFIPKRSFDLQDVVADMLGVLFYYCLASLVLIISKVSKKKYHRKV